MNTPPPRNTSFPFVWDGRVLQLQYSPSGQFEDIDDLDYDSKVIDTEDCTGAFRIIDISMTAADTAGLPRASTREPRISAHGHA